MSKEIQEWKQATHFQHSVHSVGRSCEDGRENLATNLYTFRYERSDELGGLEEILLLLLL